MPEENIEVRDLRHQEWLWTSKNFLFHKGVDEKMYKVYSGLAAYANNQTQKAYPSIGTLQEKLNMGRNTVIRAIAKLEKGGFVSIQKEKGANNVYSLLEVHQAETVQGTTDTMLPKLKTPPPSHKAIQFFMGVQHLRDKKTSLEADEVRDFLLSLTNKYPKVSKQTMWEEIRKFEMYWTELNATGTKERWQKEPTFQVERRLVTWFSKKKEFSSARFMAPPKRIV